MGNLKSGCKAIIVGGEVKSNIGILVDVGNFIGVRLDFSARDLWEVSPPILFNNGGVYNLCSGKTMQRIDDDETSLTEIEKENEVTV